MECFQRAIAADPTEGPAHREIGLLLWEEGENDVAEKGLRRALELNGDDVWAHDYLGHVLYSTDRYKEAEVYLERSLKSDPTNKRTQLLLAELRETTPEKP